MLVTRCVGSHELNVLICFSTGAVISSKVTDRDPLIKAISRTSVNLKFRVVELKD